MRRSHCFLSVILLMPFSFPALAHAQQPWSGVISTARGSAWSNAGLPGDMLPDASWSQCGSTIAAYGSSGSYASASTINAAISACSANHYVLLEAGTFYLNSCINHKTSNVVLRGSGANSTFIQYASGLTGCGSLFAGTTTNLGGSSSMWGTTSYPAGCGGCNTANWTGGYSQGTTTITLDNVTGIATNLTPIVLDACNTGFTGTVGQGSCTGSWTDNGNFNVCDENGVCDSQTAVTGVYRPNRAQEEIVIATSITGSGPYTVTLSEPISNPNWSSLSTPEAWWQSSGTTVTNSGIENLSIKVNGNALNGVAIGNCYKCWVSGVATEAANFVHIGAYYSSHILIANNYGFQTYSAGSTSYGFGGAVVGDLLVENNIVQQVATPLTLDGPCAPSCVFAYNFSVDPYYGNAGYMFETADAHSAGLSQVLYEGNIGGQIDADAIHGTHNMFTIFRNYMTGFQANATTTPGIPSGTVSVTAGSPTVTWVSGAMFQTGWLSGSDVVFIYNPSTGKYGLYFLNSVGSTNSMTLSRNIDPGGTGTVSYFAGPYRNTDAIHLASYMRYMNVIGNALGTAGFHYAYECLAPDQTTSPCPNQGRSVYDLGYSSNTHGQIETSGNTPYDDPLVGLTRMFWGNYDVVNGTVQWNPSEVPSNDFYYPNSVPSSQSLPSSFYNGVTGAYPNCATGLNFWKNPTSGTCPPYPPIGPDVSNGNLKVCSTVGSNYLFSVVLSSSQCGGGSAATAVAGYANGNPAIVCYLNQMSGPPDGTGSMLTFNPSACYAKDVRLAPPTNLNGVVY